MRRDNGEYYNHEQGVSSYIFNQDIPMFNHLIKKYKYWWNIFRYLRNLSSMYIHVTYKTKSDTMFILRMDYNLDKISCEAV